jgi:hypothetical protein
MIIFTKEIFSLKELCTTVIEYIYKKNILYDSILSEILSEILFICDIYLLFSSGNKNYIKFLNKIRNTKGYFFTNSSNKYIYFREILQTFDLEFTKLVIRIKVDTKNYEKYVSWNEFEEKIGMTKTEFEDFFINL